jgi:hypothetical protein
MTRRGRIEQRRTRPGEDRILVTLWHPQQTIGDGCGRSESAVETFRSLPLDGAVRLLLFDASS